MNKLAALLLAGSAAACATNGTPSEEGSPIQHLPKTSSPSFTLFVSNQSLDKQLVDIQVFIDGQLAVSGDFSVFEAHNSDEGCGGAPLPQHNWYEFGFNLTPGAHSITVISADTTTTLETSNNGMRWGVLDFWYDATTDEPEHFNFTPTANEPFFQ